MKKLLPLLVLMSALTAHAEYTAENKIIKVVIPQPPASGLGALYRHIEVYANKQNIKMTPVFKPGAQGKIGISYASKEKNDGDTLLLSTVSDYASVNNLNFDPVAPITKFNLTLVASKKSKIKNVNDIITQEQANPGKLTWAYRSTAQVAYIDNFVKVSNMDVNKIYKVPFGTNGETESLVNGDVDLTAVSSGIATALKDRLTIVDIDEATKKKLSIKDNASGIFLPKDSNKDSTKFWNKFINDMINDDEFKQAMKPLDANTFTNTTSSELENIINNWRL